MKIPDVTAYKEAELCLKVNVEGIYYGWKYKNNILLPSELSGLDAMFFILHFKLKFLLMIVHYQQNSKVKS